MAETAKWAYLAYPALSWMFAVVVFILVDRSLEERSDSITESTRQKQSLLGKIVTVCFYSLVGLGFVLICITLSFPFIADLLVRAFMEFVGAIGITPLGFLHSQFGQFVAFEAVAYLLGKYILPKILPSGVDALALTPKTKYQLLFGAVLYCVATLINYLPVYIRSLYKVKTEIEQQSAAHSLPICNCRLPSPPYFATELGPASIAVSLLPINGFLFDLGGPYKLKYKRQFVLRFENSTHVVDRVDVSVKFPYPVEAEKVTTVDGIRTVEFQPRRPLTNLIGAQLENNGCLGRWTYDLSIRGAQKQSRANVSLILNSQSIADPLPGISIPKVDGYILGKWSYRYRGRTVNNSLYMSLDASKPDETRVTVSTPQSDPPPGFETSSGFTVLEGPCIPSDSLIEK